MKKISLLLVCSVLSVVLYAQQTQVWDLGAQQLSGVQNMLSEAEINGWFPNATPGSTGVTVSDITASDSCNFLFNGAGKTNHRLRTENANLTCYDRKSLKDVDGNVYTGYIYSNASSTKDVYIEQQFQSGDKVEYYVGSNGGDETYALLSPSGVIEEGKYSSAVAKIVKLTFYIGESGKYRFYGVDEKLVVARIVRTPARKGSFSGKITAPTSIPDNYKLVFTNQSTNSKDTIAPNNDTYSIDNLPIGYQYEISLADANGFIVSSVNPVELTNENTTADIIIEAVNLSKVTGMIVGLPSQQLDVVEFVFVRPEDKIFEPEYTINRTTGEYQLLLETGVKYAINALNVNDYMLQFDSVVTSSDVNNMNVEFVSKPVYNVTIVPTGATADEFANAEFVFTNLNEEGYVYRFVGTQNIQLRNGVYSVKVENTGIYTQLLTSNLNISGADTQKVIDFTANVNKWNFADEDFQSGNYTDKAAQYNYKTLQFNGGQINKTYLLLGSNAVVKVPVKGNCIISVSACYEYHLLIGADTLADAKTGSTSQIDKFTYSYSGAEGVVEITSFGTSYLTEIEVTTVLPYMEIITVGVNKDYQTINDAVAAVRQMKRNSNERVTIMIDPGNYEEMLKINVDNLTLRNASANPSIATKNAGVDIDENAVRITGYYGMGYNYASMASDFLWDARTLQVNKENGYASVVNKGGSSTSYWNSTVIVSGKDFEAYDIIFENSFNQYISKKESEDLVFEVEGASKGLRPTDEGNTSVQNRSFRERACAIAFTSSADRAYMDNCRVIGRQDAFYGDQGARVAVNGGVLMGAVDYIFGGMTLACNEVELSMLVTDDKNDATYYTAAKQDAGVRGYLFYNCHVVSALPEVEMAETAYAKPGYWGRPWSPNAETVFYKTIVDSCRNTAYKGQSLIVAEGWNNGLTSTGSPRSYEYGTQECVDNSNKRLSWATVLNDSILPDGTAIILYNFTKGKDGWNPFGEVVSSVSYVKEDDLGITIYSNQDNLIIDNVNLSTNCTIYNMVGQIITSKIINGATSISLNHGVYVVVLNNAEGWQVNKLSL